MKEQNSVSGLPEKAGGRKTSLQGVKKRRKEKRLTNCRKGKENRQGRIRRNNSEEIKKKKCRERARERQRKDERVRNWHVLGATWQTLSSLLEKVS